MLAQNFKTSAALGISDQEFDALVKVLGMLERGELLDSPEHNPIASNFGFCIGCQYKNHNCGTLACIGGWVAILTNHRLGPFEYVNSYMWSGGLHELYWKYPRGAKATHAAIALRNFLTCGEPRWEEALNT